MQEIQDEVNKWETRMSIASRILAEKQQWVQQVKTQTKPGNGNNQITCYRFGGNHKQIKCKIRKEDISCFKCCKSSHLAKACRGLGKPTKAGKKKNLVRAAASAVTPPPPSQELPLEYTNAVPPPQ